MKTYKDLAGDGGSNVLEQVKELKRTVEANLAPIELSLAVGSGKGGVGKSTLTMLVALALLEEGRRVAVLDADLNGPSQARLAGMGTQTPVPGDKGLALPRTAAGVGVLSFGTLIPESRALEFPSLAQGDSHVWRAAKEFSVLAEFLARCDWTRYDTLLFDLPPGAERTFQYAEFLGAATRFLLVTLPSDVSRGVVRRSIAALRGTGNPILGYVENMAGYYCQACREVRPLFPDSRQVDLGLPRLGRIPFDPGLASLCDQGLTPDACRGSPAWKAVREIAQTLSPR